MKIYENEKNKGWLAHTYGALRIEDIKQIIIKPSSIEDTLHVKAIMNDNEEYILPILLGFASTYEECQKLIKQFLNIKE